MKTAVQQVFSELEELHPNLFNINTTEGKEFVHHFHKYIAMEKEQMIEFACQVAEASAEKYIQGKTTWQIAEELLTFKSEQ